MTDVNTEVVEATTTIPAEEETNDTLIATDSDEGQVEETKTEEEAPKPGDIKYTQKVTEKINKLTRQKMDALRDVDAKDQRIAELESQLGSKPTVEDTKPADGYHVPKPNIDNFASDADYLDALTDWKLDKKEYESKVKEQTDRSKAYSESIKDVFLEEVENSKIKERYEDFDKVVNESKVFTPKVGELIMTSENGPDLAYYLAKNPKEADSLAVLAERSQIEAARRMERLSITLQTDKHRKLDSKAPEPLDTVGGDNTSAVTEAKPGTPEWFEKRNKEVRARRVQK